MKAPRRRSIRILPPASLSRPTPIEHPDLPQPEVDQADFSGAVQAGQWFRPLPCTLECVPRYATNFKFIPLVPRVGVWRCLMVIRFSLESIAPLAHELLDEEFLCNWLTLSPAAQSKHTLENRES